MNLSLKSPLAEAMLKSLKETGIGKPLEFDLPPALIGTPGEPTQAILTEKKDRLWSVSLYWHGIPVGAALVEEHGGQLIFEEA